MAALNADQLQAISELIMQVEETEMPDGLSVSEIKLTIGEGDKAYPITICRRVIDTDGAKIGPLTIQVS